MNLIRWTFLIFIFVFINLSLNLHDHSDDNHKDDRQECIQCNLIKLCKNYNTAEDLCSIKSNFLLFDNSGIGHKYSESSKQKIWYQPTRAPPHS